MNQMLYRTPQLVIIEPVSQASFQNGDTLADGQVSVVQFANDLKRLSAHILFHVFNPPQNFWDCQTRRAEFQQDSFSDFPVS
jgi:hypothetical protein